MKLLVRKDVPEEMHPVVLSLLLLFASVACKPMTFGGPLLHFPLPADTSGDDDTALKVTDTDSGEPHTAGEDTGWDDGIAQIAGKGLYFNTIQKAIEQAADGDTVLVAPGLHLERIDFHGKAIVVRSIAGAAETLLDGQGEGSVVSMRAQEPATAVLEGFTIQNGRGTEGHGGGIFVENADPIIRHNIIVNNSARIAGGVYMRHGYATVTNNIIAFNHAEEGGGGVVCTNCKGEIRFNTLYLNTSRDGPVGEWFYEPQGNLKGNIFIVPEGSSWAFRYMEARGYTFENQYNLLWPQVSWASATAGTPWPEGDGLLYADPGFSGADAGNFQLRAGSPAVDAGPPGIQDPDGSPADLGAFGGPDGAWLGL